MNIPIPEGEYIKEIQVNDNSIDVSFLKRKKVALVFISLNDRYWPYLAQVIKDCRTHFLPQHKVDYFAWTDYSNEVKDKRVASLRTLENSEAGMSTLLTSLTECVRLYERFYPAEVLEIVQHLAKNGLMLRREGAKTFLDSTHQFSPNDAELLIQAVDKILTLSYADMDSALKGVNIIETEPVEWPAPTLMRYHLFLNEEERLKEYDYIFYLDADMRVVAKISDELFNNGLLAAEHPMYSLRKEYIPPYEPNPNSTAYIKRTGRVVNEDGKARFKPYYYAGGFQGGRADLFIEAMKTMKKNIDKDFDNNYVAIWNDESHWNKYLADYEGELTVLSPSYVYPDSLIDEYYVKVWGKKYEPKIVTLTKPFTLSAEGAEAINKFTKQ